MRAKLGYILPMFLIATPVFAQNWSYQPAPNDWYVSQDAKQSQTNADQNSGQAVISGSFMQNAQQYPQIPDAAFGNSNAQSYAPLGHNIAPKNLPINNTKEVAPKVENDVSEWTPISASSAAPALDNNVTAPVNTEFTQATPSLDDKTQVRAANQMAQNSVGLNAAVKCAASLQIAALAAPDWSSEAGVAQATNLWLERVFSEADKAGVAGDKVKDMVKAEMDSQTSAAVNDPKALNKNAFDCATNMPTAS